MINEYFFMAISQYEVKDYFVGSVLSWFRRFGRDSELSLAMRRAD